jgi:hypothetical protein
MKKLIPLLLLLASFGCQTAPPPPEDPLEARVIHPEAYTPAEAVKSSPVTADDWRLKGKEDLDEYMMDVTLVHRGYRPNPEEEWDHDHCTFCDLPFSISEVHKDCLTVGYVTENHYHWVCERCFGDFKPRFKWSVIEAMD